MESNNETVLAGVALVGYSREHAVMWQASRYFHATISYARRDSWFHFILYELC
jgi:hypothetical protein